MNELEKDKYFKECYKMWLKVKNKKNTQNNFQEFTILWNGRIKVAEERAIFSLYNLLESDIIMAKDTNNTSKENNK